MKNTATNNDKINPFTVSYQVKAILHKKGLSQAFNYADYEYFKIKCRNAFNKAQAIANLFIEEYREESNLKDYQF
ncbi:hypothetical protein [Sediminibacter sp. Hel_I_10]|uniref:hypothetical protein n=1 Tax=Sediminibacter sp. Hel_I_10 TaxID=1392490 RepID=UPI0018CBF4D1|nr:hypothetical protein [Sediminibacter sp. Hel_I_10]